MNKEETIIYVFATTNEMRECFKTYEHLFDKYSKINCYGILKNGIKIQFANNIRGLRSVKTYDEIRWYLQEMNNSYLQQENKQLKEDINKVWEWVIYQQQHSIEPVISTDELDEILEILKGDSNE